MHNAGAKQWYMSVYLRFICYTEPSTHYTRKKFKGNQYACTVFRFGHFDRHKRQKYCRRFNKPLDTLDEFKNNFNINKQGTLTAA